MTLQRQKTRLFLLAGLFFSSFLSLHAQPSSQKLAFTVDMEQPGTHAYHVTLRCEGLDGKPLSFRMPAWTPGYYQLMNYAQQVENFSATDADGKPLKWEKANSTWTVQNGPTKTMILSYDVKATRNFVAGNYLDENKGYISPAGLCLYPIGQLRQPVTITLHPYANWPGLIATGLDPVAGKANTFVAPDFDVLYDSPILMGKLEQLPEFKVKGIPHYFIGYQLGDFDRNQFMGDLKKIVEQGAAIIGDIPYPHYTFIAIGPGGGGIEHLNSTAISFDGNGLNTPEGKLKLYNFLAHEYFHHYNVKRIRPIELGPFNYDAENRTKLLWVSEGFTVYYEYLMLKRAGLSTEDDVLRALQTNIRGYENKPGHLFQSATQSSYETWEDGPFGRTGDEAYKTISYYNKGPALGMLLDFKIRHETQNRKSLDDVMRALYREYYQKQKRGFSEEEFRATCETIAGVPLTEVFEYASTVKPIDYRKYLAYAGLTIDDTSQDLPGAWLGATARVRNDSLVVTEAEWESPAWKAGLRNGSVIQQIDGKPATSALLNSVTKDRKPGDSIRLLVSRAGQPMEVSVVLGKKAEPSFKITRLPNPSSQQAVLLKDWLKN